MKEGLIESAKRKIKYWWVSLLVGVLAIILGVWSLLTPDLTLVAMTYVFICIFFINGISEIAFAISNRNLLRGWGWTLAGGIIEILFAILLLALPKVFLATVLVLLVGFWLLFRSIWSIGGACELQVLGVKGWGWSLAGAILSLLIAFLFLLSPAFFKGIFVVALISVGFFIYGMLRIYMAFRLRSIHKEVKEWMGE